MTAIGTWVWRREISVSSQLETVLQKMLINRTLATNPLRKCSKPCSPTPLHRRQTPTSPKCVPSTLSENLSLILATAKKGGTQIIATHSSSGLASPLGSQGCRCRHDCIDWNECWTLEFSDSFNTVLPVGQRSAPHSSSEYPSVENMTVSKL